WTRTGRDGDRALYTVGRIDSARSRPSPADGSPRPSGCFPAALARAASRSRTLGLVTIPGAPPPSSRLQESVGSLLKRILLGRPLTNEQLRGERLSNPVALGVLSSDAMSSAAYGTEEILIELLPWAGLAAFAVLLPITGVILLILALVATSYRQVVMVYTKAGGS